MDMELSMGLWLPFEFESIRRYWFSVSVHASLLLSLALFLHSPAGAFIVRIHFYLKMPFTVSSQSGMRVNVS